MTTYHFFLGLDISKDTVEATLLTADGQPLLHQQLPNQVDALLAWLSQLPQQVSHWQLSQTLACAEHTGMYSYPLTQLVAHGLPLWLESGKQIKHSGGLQRGKTDAVDADRIARYAYLHQQQARLWLPPSPVLQRLKHLESLRQRLLAARQQLQVPLQEQAPFMDPADYACLLTLTQPGIDALSSQLALLQVEIDQLLADDDQLRGLLQQVQSVPGIGPVIARQLVLQTDAFQRFSQARQLACHCGVAPFAYQSGKSVRARCAVSHHANKELKRLLHLAACCVSRGQGEFAQYYRRKLAQGKARMSALNALRNKLLHVVFAIVKGQTRFEANWSINHLTKA